MTNAKLVDFRSDNVAPVASEVLRDLNAMARNAASPYGADDVTERLGALLTDVFGQTAVAWPVPTGTAANAVTITRPPSKRRRRRSTPAPTVGDPSPITTVNGCSQPVQKRGRACCKIGRIKIRTYRLGRFEQ